MGEIKTYGGECFRKSRFAFNFFFAGRPVDRSDEWNTIHVNGVERMKAIRCVFGNFHEPLYTIVTEQLDSEA